MPTRTKEAIKTGLAMAIVCGIALSMDWEKPYWAGYAVACTIMLSILTTELPPTAGQRDLAIAIAGPKAVCPQETDNTPHRLPLPYDLLLGQKQRRA